LANITVHVDNEFVDALAAAIVRQQLGGQVVGGGQGQAPADAPPWPPEQSADDDPWGAPPGNPNPNPAPPAAPPTPPPPAPPQTGTFQVQTPKGMQQWTLGSQNAPACGCGQPAAYIQGSTNGRAWARWGCAKGKDKATYRSKCDFSQWA